MTAPNAALAYEVLDYIDAHPEEWNQRRWVCGTAACFAGWAVRLSGAEIRQTEPDEPNSAKVVAGPAELVGLTVEEAAHEVLGIHRYAMVNEDLFDAWNSREDVGRIVAQIFGPRPEAGPVNEIDDSLSEPGMPVYAPCRPIGCDNGYHLPGCVFGEAS